MSSAGDASVWKELTRSESEDIRATAGRWKRYEAVYPVIEQFLSDEKKIEVYIDEMVDFYSRNKWGGDWKSIIIDAGLFFHQKRKKQRLVRDVLEEKLKQIFDITLPIQPMKYEHLRRTCDFVSGNPKYFDIHDIAYFYATILSQLMGGPIRDKCRKLGIWPYVNERIEEVRANELEFRTDVATRRIG